QAGAGAARDERHPGLVAGPDHRGDVRGGLGQHDQPGHDLVVGEPVALVRAQLLPVVDHLRGTQFRPEAGRELGQTGHGSAPYGIRSYAGRVRNSANSSDSAISENNAFASSHRRPGPSVRTLARSSSMMRSTSSRVT